MATEGQRIKELETSLSAITEKLAGVMPYLEALQNGETVKVTFDDATMAGITDRLDAIEGKLTEQAETFTSINERIEAHHTALAEHSATLEQHTGTLAEGTRELMDGELLTVEGTFEGTPDETRALLLKAFRQIETIANQLNIGLPG